MFSRLISFTLMAMPLLAAATEVWRTDASEECPTNTGSLQCCTTVQDASGEESQNFLSTATGQLIEAAVGPITGTVGLNCSRVVGLITTSSCTQQAVCCTNNNFNGLINIGCTPITIVV